MTDQEVYDQYAPLIWAHFEPRWRSFQGKNLSASQFASVIDRLITDWVIFYQRYAPRSKNLYHTIGPTVGTTYYWTMLTFVERILGKRTPESNALMAHFLGVPPEEYLWRWRKSHDDYMNM